VLTIVTGKPGAGKTLWSLKEIETLRLQSKRPVYYHGIPGLKLDWVPLEKPEDWHLCPSGSVIIIDEAQHTFPNRPQGSALPLHVQEFQTHRHKGLDVYLLTQDPFLLDFAVRKLCGRHVHLDRPGNAGYSRLFEWQEVKNPARLHWEKKDALSTSRFKHDPRLFEFYSSADIHTHHSRIPWLRLASVVGLAVVGVVLLWSGYRTVSGPAAPVVEPVAAVVESPGRVVPRGSLHAADFEPEVPGLPFTAPAFQKVAQVRSFPRPTGCYLIEADGLVSRCKCFSQQATRIEMPTAQCVAIVRDGWFDFSKSDDGESRGRAVRPDREDRGPGARPQSPLAGVMN
jgi:zona occludens toxin